MVRVMENTNRTDATALPKKPCLYGHFDCATTEGGPCFNEAEASRYDEATE